MLGRLTWAAIPFNDPIPLLTGAVVLIVIMAVLGLITVKGWWPYLWREWITSVDHKRIGVMYMILGLVMLLRGFADALMMRTQQAVAIGEAPGISAAGSLRPDLHGPRRDHDFLRGHAVGDGTDELRRAAADRRARRGVSVAQFGQLLDDRRRRAAGQCLAGRRRISPAPVGWHTRRCRSSPIPGRRRRLLHLVAADLRRRDLAYRGQFHRHHPQDARPGHEPNADAGVLLDGTVHEHADRRGVPDPDCVLR